jgi:hypothetical protein
LAFAYKGMDIVFRSIIEYSRLRDFGFETLPEVSVMIL